LGFRVALSPPGIPNSAETTHVERMPSAREAITNSIGMTLALIPNGTFTMGEGDEALQVTLTHPFQLGVYEVTQEEYEKVMGNNPSVFKKDPQNPVETVSWYDAVEFCKKLSQLPEEKAAGRVYRLPTEAEWEYACRAGSTTQYSFGNIEERLSVYAWYYSTKIADSKYGPQPVGRKKPNAWGLYDMHGNVGEWCSDWYGEYPKGAVSDPSGPREGSSRVCRGGSWCNDAAGCRSSFRLSRSPEERGNNGGFRVALSSPGIPEVAEPGADTDQDYVKKLKAEKAKMNEDTAPEPQPPLKEITNSIGMKLVLIPKGTFTRENSLVTISRDYYLGVYEVTQSQYEKVMGTNPSYFQGDNVANVDSSNHPVEMVSWEEAVEFCKRLSELPEEKAAGRVYRLPTEAEWEYACRAGTTTKYSFGDDDGQLGKYAWYVGHSNRKTHPFGEKKSNAWGLSDMHGNVWEWCSDWYDEYHEGAVSDPSGPKAGVYRVYRGGSWGHEAALCRSSFRFRGPPTIRLSNCGFRVALSSPSGIPK
jgi:formylglycine-generating enzyme required for sulfatase activity